MRKILLAVTLSMLLAGAALAGSCSTYCGHSVSIMKKTLIAGVAALLLATTARADDLDWDKLHAATVALYGECDLNISIAGRERLRVRSYCSKDDRTTFDADDYLVFTEYKNRERYHNGEKICPRPVRVDR